MKHNDEYSEVELTEEEVENFWKGKNSTRHWFLDGEYMFTLAIAIALGGLFAVVCFSKVI